MAAVVYLVHFLIYVVEKSYFTQNGHVETSSTFFGLCRKGNQKEISSKTKGAHLETSQSISARSELRRGRSSHSAQGNCQEPAEMLVLLGLGAGNGSVSKFWSRCGMAGLKETTSKPATFGASPISRHGQMAHVCFGFPKGNGFRGFPISQIGSGVVRGGRKFWKAGLP